jgi:hypothetical protein
MQTHSHSLGKGGGYQAMLFGRKYEKGEQRKKVENEEKGRNRERSWKVPKP